MRDGQALKERLAFVQLDDDATKAIRSLKPLIDKALPEALDFFYAHIRNYPEVGRHFQESSRAQRAKTSQLTHWQRISAGDFTQDYLQSVRVIGQTHARVGIEPRWYIGGYALLTEKLVAAAIMTLWPQGWLSKSKQPPAEIAAALGALLKAVFLDMDLAISTYIDAAEERRLQAEEARAQAAQQQTLVVDALRAGLTALAKGDLTYRSTETFDPAYLQLQEDFNSAMAQMQQTMQAISSAVHEVASASAEISIGTSDLSQRTEEQAASLEQTSSSLEEISQIAKQNAENTSKASLLTSRAREVADGGGGVISEAVGAMGRIEESSTQIANIIGVIDEIARQTNLLALNAAVEAARAGEAGRGFAVVASEVRSLAQRSSQAAKDIKDLIVGSSAQVEDGVGLVGKTGVTLTDIAKSVHDVANIVTQIAEASTEQSTGIGQINIAIAQLDEMTQQNSALVEENAATAKALEEQTSAIEARLQFFTLGNERAAGGTNILRTEKAGADRRASLTAIRGGRRS